MTDNHDPMALLADAPPIPAPSRWESLAQQARWLAEQAQRVAALEPQDRYLDDDEDLNRAITDELAMMDTRTASPRSLVAACRRDTFRTLRKRGWSIPDIAKHLGHQRQSGLQGARRTETQAVAITPASVVWTDRLDGRAGRGDRERAAVLRGGEPTTDAGCR